MKKSLCLLTLALAVVPLVACNPSAVESSTNSNETSFKDSSSRPSSGPSLDLEYSPAEKLIIGAIQLQYGALMGNVSIYDDATSIMDLALDLKSHVNVDEDANYDIELQGELKGQLFNKDIELSVSYYDETFFMLSEVGKAKMHIDSVDRISVLINRIANQLKTETPEEMNLDFSILDFSIEDLTPILDEIVEKETEEGTLLTLTLSEGYDINILLDSSSYQIKNVELMDASLGQYTLDLSLNVEYLTSNQIVKLLDEESYIDMAPSVELLDTISKFIDNPLLNVDLDLEIYQNKSIIDEVTKEEIGIEEVLAYDVATNAQLDFANNQYYAKVDVIDEEQEHHAEGHYLDDVLYVSYNTLKVALERESISNMFETVLSLVGETANDTLDSLNSFLDGFDKEKINEYLDSFDLNDVATLRYDENELYLAIDSNSFGLDGLFELSLPRDGSGLNYIKAHVVTETQRVEVLLNADTGVKIPTFNKAEYQNWSSMSQLIDLFKNTAVLTDFDIQGSINMSFGVFGGMDVPTLAKIKINDDQTTSIAIKFNVPINVLTHDVIKINEDIKDRVADIYIENGMVYIHRQEMIRTRSSIFGKWGEYALYEECIMVSQEEFMANMPKYFAIAFGLTDTIKNAMNSSFESSTQESGPVHYDQVIKSFSYSEKNGFAIVLNLKELMKKSSFDECSINIKSSDGTNVTDLHVETKLIGFITLSCDFSLKNIGQEVDLSQMHEYIANYIYAEGEHHKSA